MRLVLTASVALVFLAACGEEESLPQKPQLRVDRVLMDFGTESGGATYVGTAPQESLQIRNEGLETLKINSVVKTGDPAFELEPPLKTELKGKEITFLRVIFRPTSVAADGGTRDYIGTLFIDANHEVTQAWANPVQIQLHGRAIRPPPNDGGI
jgi:hypothetical protein